MGASDELEIAGHLLVAAVGKEALFLDCLEQHRLFVRTEFTDFIEKQQTAVGAAQQSGAFGLRAGERAAHMAKQCRHRCIAAQCCAVHFDKAAGNALTLALQFVNAARKEGFPRAGWPHQQKWRAGIHGHAFELLNCLVESRVARGNAGFEKREALALRTFESLCDGVVA